MISKVVARCRPFTLKERESNTRNIVYRLEGGAFELREYSDGLSAQKGPKGGSSESVKFTVDKFIDKNVNNRQFHEEVCSPIVDNLMRGINSSVITFGVYGTGKSHSVFVSTDDEGLVYTIVDDVLDRLHKSDQYLKSSITINIIEVVNEVIYDVLGGETGNEKKIELREGYESWANLTEVTEETIASKRDLRVILK